MENMGLNKTCVPDDLPVEDVKILASYSVDHVTVTANTNVVMQDGMPVSRFALVSGLRV